MARWPAFLFFSGVFTFRILHLGFENDHFDRISKGRQILAFGEVPFRDFFDPGFFLTLYSSAAVQWMFGHNLLGEALLTIGGIAAGLTLAFVMARRVSGSWLLATAVGAAGVLTLPRLYNYDKVLFFPLGLWACWRYVDRQTPERLAAMGLVTGIAALYRYDSGVYLGLAAGATILTAGAVERGRRVRRLLAYAALVAATVTPAMVYVSATAGGDAFRQIAEYGRREALRTEVLSPPRFSVDLSMPVLTIGRPLRVRFAPGLADDEREGVERRYALRHGVPQDGRTWQYRLADVSPDNVRGLVLDPLVEDTHGIDRSEEGTRRVTQSVTLLPGVLTRHNAAAWIAWVLLAVPLVVLYAAMTGRAGLQHSQLIGAAVLCLFADVFLLRDPVEARIGDVAAPALPLAAWAIARAYAQQGAWRRLVRAIAAVVLLTSSVALATYAMPVLRSGTGGPPLAALAERPPSDALLPSGHVLRIVEYLRQCTMPEHRFMAAWFAPEIYYFSGRGFAGGMSVYFGAHWSGAADQRRAFRRLERQPVPVAIVHLPSYAEFRNDYPVLDFYLQSEYVAAAQSAMGDPDAEYRILLRKDAVPAGTWSRDALPCLR